MTEKFCTKCGKKFMAIGRQVICPECKTAAEEESKRAAVERAKQASWAGESVPVRISGRASTIIRAYGAEKRLPFAAALDSLLQSTACFKGMQMAWEEVEPYKSRRRDKHATADNEQAAQEAPQEVTKAAKAVSKKSTATSKKVATAAGKKVKA